MRRSLPRVPRTQGLALTLAFVTALLVGGAYSARPEAQAPAPATTLGQLIIVDVKPEAWDDYAAMQKAETIPALKKAGIERRRAWRVQGLGRGFRVAYLYPMSSLGRLDDKAPIVRALGEEGAKAYNARLRRFIEGTRSLAFRTRTELSYGLDGPLPTLGVVARVLTVSGRQFEFEAFLKDQWSPALKKAGVPLYVVQEIMVGGEMGEYYTFTPIPNFAALDGGHPILKALGAAEYQALIGKMGPTIRSVEREVMKLDEELSFDTRATTK